MITVQDVFAKFYTEYLKKHTPYNDQSSAARFIIACRTSELGATVYKCNSCEHTSLSYNSCNNRHCPLCQGVKKAVWVDKRNKDIIDGPYFHLVFTVPEKLRMLIYQNQKLLYSLMHKCVSKTLSELAKDKKYLGAQIGFFSILHTWGQDLNYHPHIHVVVLAGGLTKNNTWVDTGGKFFIPVKVLSKMFRGKFLHFLKKLYKKEKLVFYGDAVKFQSKKAFNKLVDGCYQTNWYSYSKRTFSGPVAVLKYLGNYTHRIAIANSRIISMDNDTVTISIKDYKDKARKKTITLTGVEFIRRFLMHVLPKGFVKIRHYGILANRNKKVKLALCRKLTSSPQYKERFEGLTTIEIISSLIGKDVSKCPNCKVGKLKENYILRPRSSP